MEDNIESREVYMDHESENDVQSSESEDSDCDDEIKFQDINRWWHKPIANTLREPSTFAGSVSGFIPDAAPQLDPDSWTPASIFFIFFEDIIPILVEETNRYYHQYLAKKYPEGGPSPQVDVSSNEMVSFISLVLQMGHDYRDNLRDYWSLNEQFYTPFYGNVMNRARYQHILRFLHFQDNSTTDRSNKLWKVKNILDKLNDAFAQFYNPTEKLAIDEVILPLRSKVVYKQYIPQKPKHGMKIYQLCDVDGYTYSMAINIGRKTKASTYVIAKELTQKIGGLSHKVYVDNFFTSVELFNKLEEEIIYCCGIVGKNCKDVPLLKTSFNLKQGDVRTQVKDNLTAIVWKSKTNVYVLSNIHSPPKEGNFCNKASKPIRPALLNDYAKIMESMDAVRRMTTNHNITRNWWKWTKKLFFHLLNVTVANSFVISKSLGNKNWHREFRLELVKDLIELTGTKKTTVSRPLSGSVLRLEAKDSEHWPEKVGSKRRCPVCSKNKETSRSFVQCKKCKVCLCIDQCFLTYHTQKSLLHKKS